jgi:hypothetical protein
MLALVASIHVWNTNSISEDVDGRDKPDHDEELFAVKALSSSADTPS